MIPEGSSEPDDGDASRTGMKERESRVVVLNQQ